MTQVVVIGAYGSAGVKVASDLADAPDMDLTLIDDGDPGGGLCILRGCMPSKEVLSTAAHRYQTRSDPRLDGHPEVDLVAVVDAKNEHTSNFAAHRRTAVHNLAERENVEFIHDTARFSGDRTVQVDDRRIEADYVVIATGSTHLVPDLPGLAEVDYMTSDDVLDATEFAETGVAIGFGYIGAELVPYLSEAAGMDLTVLDRNETPLADADPEFGSRLLEIYQDEFGIDIMTGAEAQAVEATDTGVRVTVERDGETEAVEADQLFLFTGRRPAVAQLGLENTAIEAEPGWVTDTMQTGADPRVFAVGDVNGREPLLHVAKEQGAVAAQNILADRDSAALRSYQPLTHHVVFSGLAVYPFAHLGLTEQDAQAADLNYAAVTREASDDGVFITKDTPLGLAKLIVDETDGTVLGYQGLHYHADVMAKTMQVVLDQEQDVREIPDRSYHPTTPEIIDGLLRNAKQQLD